MEIRDWIALFTPIILIVTIISSHIIISKQTRKNKRAKWIEDLRLEVANVISLSQQVENGNVNTLFPFSKSGYVVTMLLDQNKKTEEDLLLEIQAFGIFMTEKFNANHVQEYKTRVTKITNLTKLVIYQEERKL
jgi:hypothetical protein